MRNRRKIRILVRQWVDAQPASEEFGPVVALDVVVEAAIHFVVNFFAECDIVIRNYHLINKNIGD